MSRPLAHDHRARREAARRRLSELDVTGLLVSDDVNVRYLTGFTGSNGTLLLTRASDGDRLVTDGRYVEQAAQECPDLECMILAGRPWSQPVTLADLAGPRLGFESEHLSHAEAEDLTTAMRPGKVTCVPVRAAIEPLREIKDEAELDALSRACALTVATWTEALSWLAPGQSELAIAKRLDRELVDRGAQAPAFETIVATGPNSAIPHHHPTTRVTIAGDLIKIDFGARVDGYHADMTRTVALGDPGATAQSWHAAVQASQAAGVAAVAVDAPVRDIDEACRVELRSAGLEDRFVHGTGHGIGLRIHEAPMIGPTGTASLRAQSVITVEPGVYLPGRGGVRIEDSVVVTAHGPRVLTDATRELCIL